MMEELKIEDVCTTLNEIMERTSGTYMNSSIHTRKSYCTRNQDENIVDGVHFSLFSWSPGPPETENQKYPLSAGAKIIYI